MNKQKLIDIVNDTINCIDNGKYTNQHGRIFYFDDVTRNTLYEPNSLESFFIKTNQRINIHPNTKIIKSTTLDAAKEFENDICVLNFASAISLGGGVFRGSVAQEESICRASTLLGSLKNCTEYYKANISHHMEDCWQRNLYTDNIIYSPIVTVFKSEDGEYLDNPYKISVVTSPAPMMKTILNESDYHDKLFYDEINNVIFIRIIKIIATMVSNKHRNIILGAWGCGAFGNDPEVIANYFKQALNIFPYFDNIIFAIYDEEDSERFIAFKNEFM